ncbi:MAG: hypothetical protein JOZ68_15605 [Acidimicrobiia bacterium]|nr:hypothetical protein [Acidimicrobiia bacterium]
MRVRVVAVGTAALVACVLPLARASSPQPASAPNGPALGALVSGQTSYVNGALVWTDYAYDDRGTNTAAGGEGAATYSSTPPNAADLIQLQLAPATNGTKITAVLETLVDPSLPLLGVGFDTDGNSATGAPGIPGGSWKVKGPLGLDRFLVADNSGGILYAWNGAGWYPVASFPTTIDPTANTMTTTIPSSVLPVIGDAPWKVTGVLGVTPASWMMGGPVYDLAFVGGELPAGWQDAKQADVLAGRLPASEAEVTVDVAKVRNKSTYTPAVGSGYHTFLYHSGLKLAEGTAPVSIEGANSLYYLGPYQPYMVWIPKHLPPGPAPLLTMLHGALGNHMQAVFAGAPPPSGPGAFFFGNTTFDVPAIVVTPLGRSETDYYFGIAEQDILDVISDARRRFDIDPNRMVLSGISLGGQGTWRFSELHPDMFSAIVPMIAPSTFPLEQVVGPLRHIFPNAEENVTDIPVRVLAGRLDPLSDEIAVDGQDTDFVNATRLGIDMRYWQMLLRHHQVVPAAQNCVLLEALTHRRNTNPARVVYTTEPDLEMSDPSTGLNLRYRSAYWVTDVEARVDSTPKATIDVSSLARADRSTSSSVQPPAFGQNIVTPGDVCGTPGSTVQTRDAWYKLENRVTPGPAQPTLNGLRVKLTNVATTTLDLTRASIETGSPVQLSVTGDGPATIVLTGPWSGRVSVTRDGAEVGTLTPTNGHLSLGADFSGTHAYVLTPNS